MSRGVHPSPGSAPTTISSRQARTDAILRAALEELVSAGYGGLSFERIASRVGVNKTTIYRRYPTKPELVKAVLENYGRNFDELIADTGSLRGDLIALGSSVVRVCSSFAGQSLYRIMMLERMDPELERLAHGMEDERKSRIEPIAARALSRGELQSMQQAFEVISTLASAIIYRVILNRQLVDELELVRLVDLLLYGALRTDARK